MLTIVFKDLGRYVNDNGLKQTPYTVDVSFLGESYYKGENVVFDNYQATTASLTSSKKINLASLLKTLEINLKPSQGFVYDDTVTISSFNPYISFYEINGVYPYPSDGQLKVSKTQSFKLIYSYFDYYSLPKSASFVLKYACGTESESSVITIPINTTLKEESVETIQTIYLNCLTGPAG